jgi:hypothetical protein
MSDNNEEEFYTYSDWWEGRIAFGGRISFESDDEKEETDRHLKFVSWSEVMVRN